METVRVELTVADPVFVLSQLQQLDITVRHVEEAAAYALRFRMERKQLPLLLGYIRRCGIPCKQLDNTGILWRLHPLLQRPVLLVGTVLLLFLSFWLPSRILFVQVQGNALVPATQIVEAATECGVYFGGKTGLVRSETVKNKLLEAIPQLHWAGVSVRGCVATITVQEAAPLPTQPAAGPGNIVAACDGLIREMTTLQGTALCRPGDAVRKGQVLISGYQNSGLVLRATRAQGDVYAYTHRVITAVTPEKCHRKDQITVIGRKYSLILGKKQINFTNNSGILGITCAKIYEENYINLPGGFRLPVAWITETYIRYTPQTQLQSQPEMLLQCAARNWLLQRMQAGQILSAGEQITQADGVFRLVGNYSCSEMIGRFRPEENLPNYEND